MRASLWWKTIIWEVHLMIYIINWRFYTEQREARSSLLINYLPVRGRGLPNVRASYNVRYEKILLLISPLLELYRPGGQLQGEHMGKFNLQTEERQMSTVSTLSAIRLCNKEFSDRLQAQFTANISCNVSQLLEGKFIFFLWEIEREIFGQANIKI